MPSARALKGSASTTTRVLDKTVERRMTDPAELRRYYWRRFNTLTGGICANESGQPDRAKVKAWQAEHGVAADGFVGPKTYAAAKDAPKDEPKDEPKKDETPQNKTDATTQVETQPSGGGEGATQSEGHEGGGSADTQLEVLGQRKPNFLQMYPYMMKWEGGLSRNPNDTAAEHPCPAEHDGHSDWHTNRGVTWATFHSLGSEIGYDGNDTDLFFAMPDDIVQKIVKHGYWDPVHGDEYESQAIANVMTQWAWGSGVNGGLRVLKMMLPVSSWAEAPAMINAMIETDGEEAVYDALMNHRKEFLLARSAPGKKDEGSRKGWMNRHAAFDKWNRPLLE